ncbi:hypothetical protein BO79DRAFT_226691 [Aspergillus costaricaensis CBS 115574]|uniref:Uncharacterized protein n=1 Tax=Aspergillus costaricaensis CBS 115574 TaxID=1448317 RepID=A0ACD1IKY3_9EURO|nr:hypothetical protein BO79DRAFT_226691 [Aspergillus costaricaensis CBS 115574]RAK90928.1 hypothetical protein BO79DRAFT_226691 [Aspergillus costaricaensis CBS 115574]
MEFGVANFTLACGLDRHTLAKLDRGCGAAVEIPLINMHDGMRVNEMKLDGMVLPLLKFHGKAGWQVGRPLKFNPARAQITVSRSHPMDTGYSIKCTPTISSTLSTSITHGIISSLQPSIAIPLFGPDRASFLTFPSPSSGSSRRVVELSDIFAICGPEPVNRRGLSFGFAAASGSAALSHPYVHLSELLAATSDPRCITTAVSELTAVRSI